MRHGTTDGICTPNFGVAGDCLRKCICRDLSNITICRNGSSYSSKRYITIHIPHLHSCFTYKYERVVIKSLMTRERLSLLRSQAGKLHEIILQFAA